MHEQANAHHTDSIYQNEYNPHVATQCQVKSRTTRSIEANLEMGWYLCVVHFHETMVYQYHAHTELEIRILECMDKCLHICLPPRVI